jgi:hypothetical protein
MQHLWSDLCREPKEAKDLAAFLLFIKSSLGDADGAPANPVLMPPTSEMKNDPQEVVVISAENTRNALHAWFSMLTSK